MGKLREIWSKFTDTRPGRIICKTLGGFWSDDGAILAGNLAYLTLLTLFPFFIFCVTLAGTLGRTDDGLEAINFLMRSVPREASEALIGPINEVVAGKTKGGLLTFGAIVTVWTAAGFIETVRVIILKAFDKAPEQSMWYTRLQSTLIVIGSAIILLLAMTAQFALNGIRTFLETHIPWAGFLWLLRIVSYGIAPLILIFGLYWLFRALTPRECRPMSFWPGAVLTSFIWLATVNLLPLALTMLGSYSVTYGSLAGVIITLLFFYILGMGLVLGAEFNAALRRETLQGQET